MLNDEAFEQWCLRLELSKQTKLLIEHIRASPPARRVQSAAGNVSGRYPSKKMGVSIQHVTEVIVSVVNQVSNGKIAAFAHELGLSKNMVSHWYHGGRIPEIAQLLRLCYLLNISLCTIFCNDPETLRPLLRDDASLKPTPAKRRKKTEINRTYIYQVLENAILSDEQPPPPLAEVARRLGFSYSEINYLYECHRDACSIIVARHLMYRQQRKESRMQGYREEIRQIALELQTQGVSLTQKHIAPHMVQPGILRDPKVRELLRAVCRELETSDGEKAR